MTNDRGLICHMVNFPIAILQRKGFMFNDIIIFTNHQDSQQPEQRPAAKQKNWKPDQSSKVKVKVSTAKLVWATKWT